MRKLIYLPNVKCFLAGIMEIIQGIFRHRNRTKELKYHLPGMLLLSEKSLCSHKANIWVKNAPTTFFFPK